MVVTISTVTSPVHVCVVVCLVASMSVCVGGGEKSVPFCVRKSTGRLQELCDEVPNGFSSAV